MFDFGQRLRELREQRHLSQEAMGKIIGRSKPVVSSYENNLKLPSLDVLINIAALYNVSLDYLVGFEKKGNGFCRWPYRITKELLIQFYLNSTIQSKLPSVLAKDNRPL